MKVIGGRYEVIAPLGRGGMAVVYRARDQRLLREVAVKVLTPSKREESTFYFHREARAIASLSHNNIVQIHDYSGPDEKQAFIVMQLIEGGNLDRTLVKMHPLPEVVLLSVGKQISAALAHAHAKGVIHRDLKPSNAMLETTGRVLLTDFGLAKSYEQDDLLGATLAGQQTKLFGTPDFMAPEQLNHKEPGPHTDVFSMSTMLHYLAANALPFFHKDMFAAMKRIAAVDFDPLAADRPDLSPALISLLQACFDPEPGRRPTAESFTQACTDLLAARQVVDAERAIREFTARVRKNDRDAQPTLDDGGQPKPPIRTKVYEPGSAKGRGRSARDEPTTDDLNGPPVDPITDDLNEVSGGRPVAAAASSAPQRSASERSGSSRASPQGVGPAVGPTPGLGNQSATEIMPSLADAVRSSSAAPAAAMAVDLSQAATITALPGDTDRQALESFLERRRTSRAEEATRVPVLPILAIVAVTFVVVLVAALALEEVRSKPTTTEVMELVAPNTSPAAKMGTLLLEVRPWGMVSVDGQSRGRSPPLRRLDLVAGKRTVTVTHDTLGQQNKSVDVEAGKTTKVSFVFEKHPPRR